MFWSKYPYTDAHELNLDWVIAEIMRLHRDYDEFKAVNKITNAGAWDITKQYQAWTVVSDNNVGYISLKPVPAGVAITNTDYWGLIADYDILITDLSNRISALENTVGDSSSGLVKDVDDLQTDVSGLRSDVNLMINKKYIMLTDSFGENVTPNISTLVPSQMGWSNSDYYTIVQGGSGFGPSAPYQYLTNLQGQSAGIVSHFGSAETVTDIIVTGGTNDSYYTDPQTDIIAGINSFITYAKTTYPNAKVTLIFTGWTDDGTAVANLTYDNLCIALDAWQSVVKVGGRFFDLHNVLHLHSLFNGDHIHPTVYGQYMLADGICGLLNNGEYHVHHEIDCLLTPETGVIILHEIGFHFEQHDNNITLRTNRDITKGEIELTMQACDATGEIQHVKIGTISDWIVGNNGTGDKKLNTFTIVGHNNNAYCYPIAITFQSGDVYLSIGNYDTSTSLYHVNEWRSEAMTWDSFTC